jgi:hypothetical protein
VAFPGCFAFALSISAIVDDLLRISILFDYLRLQNEIIVMKSGPKPIGRLLIPSILQILEQFGCDLRTWTITVRLRELMNRPQLRWETVHKYLGL